MKTTDIGLLISSALGSLFLSFTPATAAILVEPIVTTPRENFSDVRGLPPTLQPFEPILWFFPPNDTGLPNLSNETGYTINKFSLLLFPELPEFEDGFVWGDVNGDGKIGLSNIFTNINIAPDFTVPFLDTNALRLELTNGTIQDGKSFALRFITSRDLTPIDTQGNDLLLIGSFYEGFRTVPEPSNVFAFVLTMALGCWLRKRKLTRT
ncbi:hypothetical protein CAL7716_107340 (plasmid) [Calothrix sp. PCC 7716]|nr:hypothetical protein CAL7716_107340 [Calothrix sp. PCC 7716]